MPPHSALSTGLLARPLSRRSMVVAALAAPLASRLSAGARQESGEPEAIALLEQAATAMAAVTSFAFALSTEEGTTEYMGLELEGISGSVQRPDRFRAVATAKLAILAVEVEAIGVGERVWVSDPTRPGQYVTIDIEQEAGSETAALTQILNPDRLLLRAVELIEEPVVRGEDDLDGVKATVIEGTFDPTKAIGLLPGTPASEQEIEEAATRAATEEELSLAGPMPVLIWIDAEKRVRRLRFEGPLLTVEQPEVVRRLDLSAFNEPVEIEAPQ